MKRKASPSRRGNTRESSSFKNQKSDPEVSLMPIVLENRKELNWLHSYIHTYHSVPKFIMPTHFELQNPSNRFFRVYEGSARHASKANFRGITSYKICTPFLAETQRTIVDPSVRGQGWGKIISEAIEKEVVRAGFYKIRSAILHDNLAMIQIKLKQGYIIEGFHPDHDGPGLHEYSLGKIVRRNKLKR